MNDPHINSFCSHISYGAKADIIFGYLLFLLTAQDTPQRGDRRRSPPAIYYNNNKSYDRQIAGFGEATYKLVDELSLVSGARYSKLGFSLDSLRERL